MPNLKDAEGRKKGGWNHRVVRSVALLSGEEQETFTIREAYYDDGQAPDARPSAITVDPVHPQSDTLRGLAWELRRMLEATKKPVIDEREWDEEARARMLARDIGRAIIEDPDLRENCLDFRALPESDSSHA